MWTIRKIKGEAVTDEAAIRQVLTKHIFRYLRGTLPLPKVIKDAIIMTFRDDQSFLMEVDPMTKGYEHIILMPVFAKFQSIMSDTQKNSRWAIRDGKIHLTHKGNTSEYSVTLDKGKYLIYNKETVLENK